MKYCIAANITPKAAVKLILTREMDLLEFVNTNQIDKIWDCLLSMSVEEIIYIIDSNRICQVADAKDIPQFGKLETLKKVPYYFNDRGSISANYAQLGFYLKNDLSASIGANTKFGENHGKGASLLGIVNCEDSKIIPSILTDSFCSLSQDQQNQALILLLFRIPVIQILLQKSKNEQVSVYEPMELLSESTKKRRSQCIKAILKKIKTLESIELNKRINNIIID